MNNDYRLIQGDCLEVMKDIPDKSIDMILCDLPYGTTACKWDNIIPFEPLWEQYNRIIKDNGAIVLFGNQPFTSRLIVSCIKLFRYTMIWEKNSPTGFLNSKYKPLSIFEDIMVFSKGTIGSRSKNKIVYNPQGLEIVNISKKNNKKSTWRVNHGYNTDNNILNSDKEFIQEYSNYPNNILKFKRDKNNIHPTQKPITLLEYLIKTYTNEGELVLDNTMGSGSTGVACLNTNRKFIGIELDKDYFKIAEERIEKTAQINGGK